MVELTNGRLKETLGMAVSVIAGEHFMSAGLSSPWSTAKFAISEEDKREVWHYFNEAAKASIVFGGIVSYMLSSIYPLASSGIILLYYKKLYGDALKRTPEKSPTPVLDNREDNREDGREIEEYGEMLSLLPPTLDEYGRYKPLSDKEIESLFSLAPNYY